MKTKMIYIMLAFFLFGCGAEPGQKDSPQAPPPPAAHAEPFVNESELKQVGCDLSAAPEAKCSTPASYAEAYRQRAALFKYIWEFNRKEKTFDKESLKNRASTLFKQINAQSLLTGFMIGQHLFPVIASEPNIVREFYLALLDIAEYHHVLLKANDPIAGPQFEFERADKSIGSSFKTRLLQISDAITKDETLDQAKEASMQVVLESLVEIAVAP